MKAEIRQEDIEKFKEFEETILNLKEPGVKYTKDLETESRIKMCVLIENFGKEKTEELLQKIRIEEKDLADQDTYIKIYNLLSTIK
jgi:hypothetical protein